jgi:hypothetical protein
MPKRMKMIIEWTAYELAVKIVNRPDPILHLKDGGGRCPKGQE